MCFLAHTGVNDKQACVKRVTTQSPAGSAVHLAASLEDGRQLASGSPTPASHCSHTHDLSAEFERFANIGDRLERELETLKDIQWEIRENEARYRDLLDNQTDVILRRDAAGRLTFVNQAFCRLFGLERGTVLGRAFSPKALAGDTATPLSPGSELRQQRYVQQIETMRGPRWFEWDEHAVRAAMPPCPRCSASVATSRRGGAQKTISRKRASRRNWPIAPSRVSWRP